MNYKLIHDNIIDRAKQRLQLNDGCYYEKHHIIPRCMGGLDIDDNLVKLTYREHFIIHWLLHLIYKDNIKLENSFKIMAYGFKIFKNNPFGFIPSSRILEAKRIELNNYHKTKEFKDMCKEKRLLKKSKPIKKEPMDLFLKRTLDQYLQGLKDGIIE